jgi:hypothetical protein
VVGTVANAIDGRVNESAGPTIVRKPGTGVSSVMKVTSAVGSLFTLILWDLLKSHYNGYNNQ